MPGQVLNFYVRHKRFCEIHTCSLISYFHLCNQYSSFLVFSPQSLLFWGQLYKETYSCAVIIDIIIVNIIKAFLKKERKKQPHSEKHSCEVHISNFPAMLINNTDCQLSGSLCKRLTLKEDNDKSFARVNIWIFSATSISVAICFLKKINIYLVQG